MFTITVYNQGTVDMSNIVVEDYIPSDMIFVPGLRFPSESNSNDPNLRQRNEY